MGPGGVPLVSPNRVAAGSVARRMRPRGSVVHAFASSPAQTRSGLPDATRRCGLLDPAVAQRSQA
eukprot:11175942-Lingulodinium_polyedra.AAC.1